jgi:hypothetical protein
MPPSKVKLVLYAFSFQVVLIWLSGQKMETLYFTLLLQVVAWNVAKN